MITKRKVMAELGSASGCVNRCLDILVQRGAQKRQSQTIAEITELIKKLEKADKAILYAAHEIDKLEDGR